MKTPTAKQAIQELTDLGYSHRSIAVAADLNQSTVSRIASGEITNIGVDTLNRILEARELTLADIAKPQ